MKHTTSILPVLLMIFTAQSIGFTSLAFAKESSSKEETEEEEEEEGYDFGSDNTTTPSQDDTSTNEPQAPAVDEEKPAPDLNQEPNEELKSDTSKENDEEGDGEDSDEKPSKKKKKKTVKKREDIIIEPSHIMRAYGLGFGSAHFSLEQYDSGYTYLATDIISLLGVSFGMFGSGYLKFFVPIGIVTFLGSHYFQGADIHEQYYRQRELLEEENPQGIQPAWSMTESKYTQKGLEDFW